jgi:hypothetical protein
VNFKIKKMKRTLLALYVICLSFSLFAEEIPLKEIEREIPGTGRLNDRETIIVPIASIENGVINIETELASWGVAVTIYNSDGAVVYTSVSAGESKLHAFAVGTLPVDDYTLEVKIGDDYYEGEILID